MDSTYRKSKVNRLIFATPRLFVRDLTADDLKDFHDLQSNSRVMRYVGGRAMNRKENRRDLERVIEAYTQPGNDFWVWAITRQMDDEFIGTCALIVNDRGEDEVGYRLRQKYWRRGYGQEISRGLLEFGLVKWKKPHIVAYVDKDNIASVKILERTMTFEKEFYNEQEGCIDRKYVAVSAPVSDGK